MEFYDAVKSTEETLYILIDLKKISKMFKISV